MNYMYIMNNFDILNINQMFQLFRLTNNNVIFALVDTGVLENTSRGTVTFSKENCLFNYNNNEINLFILKDDNYKVVTNAVKIPRSDIESMFVTTKSLSFDLKIVLKYGNFKISLYKDYNGFPNQRNMISNFKNIYKI